MPRNIGYFFPSIAKIDSLRTIRNFPLHKPLLHAPSFISQRDMERLFLCAFRTCVNPAVAMREKAKACSSVEDAMNFLTDQGPSGAFFGLLTQNETGQYWGWLGDGEEQGSVQL